MNLVLCEGSVCVVLRFSLSGVQSQLASRLATDYDDFIQEASTVEARTEEVLWRSEEAPCTATVYDELFNCAVQSCLGPLQATHRLIPSWVVAGEFVHQC